MRPQGRADQDLSVKSPCWSSMSGLARASKDVGGAGEVSTGVRTGRALVAMRR